MITLNKSAVIIKPKEPFMDWPTQSNSMAGKGGEQPSENIQNESFVILIPRYFSDTSARAYINAMWEEVFEEKLRSRCADESLWPKDRTQKMFWQWFTLKCYPSVFDSE